MPDELRILTVCTYNRTRSVMTRALLRHHLDTRGIPAALASAGFVSEGEPATSQTVRLLAEHGLDASEHRSRIISAELVAAADLIVCAEHEHVVNIAGRYRGTFERTFTLPEIVRVGSRHGRAHRDVGAWLARIAEQRHTTLDYLDAERDAIGEIADPTGGPTTDWNQTYARIDALTARLADLLD